MEKAKLYFQKSPGRFFGEYTVAITDTFGKEIVGNMQIRENSLEVGVLEVKEDKALVLLPKQLNKEIAWINTYQLN